MPLIVLRFLPDLARRGAQYFSRLQGIVALSTHLAFPAARSPGARPGPAFGRFGRRPIAPPTVPGPRYSAA